LIASFEWTKTIQRESKGNVTVITEEFVSLLDASEGDIFFLETDVIFAIEDIFDDIRIGDEIASVFHEVDHFLIFEVGFETRDDGGIGECFLRSTITIFAGFFAVWAVRLHFVRTDITDTRVDAAIIGNRTISGKEFDMGLGELERGDVMVMEGMDHLRPHFL